MRTPTSPSKPSSASSSAPLSPQLQLPLATLLDHTSAAVAEVLAGHSLTEALAACPSAARPGTQALSFHVMRWLGGAQAARAVLATRKPAPPVEALLLSALALLWPEGELPYAPHTLVDQAVACARLRHPASAGFINAVLRRFLREAATLVPQWTQRDVVARYQHPRWWVEQVRRDWPQQWQQILAASQHAGPMVLRVNARQSNAAAYQQALADIGVPSTQVGSHALVLARGVPVTALPGFEQGRVSVQDLSAQQAAPLLLGQGADRLPAGARVLDACAAPGGKTAHLLELADLDLLALDSDASRLERVAQTLQRLQLKAELRAGDARDTAAWWDGRPFDAILLDAPCSASGIVRRHPDVRWLRRANDIPTLARTQTELLDALWPLLRPGGRLVYATCSVFRAEGAGQTAAFLQRHSGVISPSAPGHILPGAENASSAGTGPVQAADKSGDGFYYARFDKPL